MQISEKMLELPLLELPLAGKEITIKILASPVEQNIIITALGYPVGQDRRHVMRCCIYEKENEQYYLELRPFILKGILKECKNNNIPIDENLNCSIGHVFTIFAKHWTEAPRVMYKEIETTKGLEPPTVYTLKFVE